MNKDASPDANNLQSTLNEPRKTLELSDAIALIIGIVVGAGIFRTPSLVAANSADETIFFSVWVLGGLMSLIGALCYAELSTAFPNTGGDYHFIYRAYGQNMGFMFAWARMTVIQTGSIALLAFIFGDYMAEVYNPIKYSSIIYAALAVVALTAINIAGVQFGSGTQKLLTGLEVIGVLFVIVAGLFFADTSVEHTHNVARASADSSFGMAMVIVLLTFGGWNEAAYISSEMKAGSQQIVRALMTGLIAITLIYLLVNFAYVNTLGLDAMSKSGAVGTDVMKATFGPPGVMILAGIVALSALTSANATMFTGARTNFALGRDFKPFGQLGRWDYKNSTPVTAFWVQALIALALISMGFFTRSGFETIVQYTAPVFWFFFLLVGIALFLLRVKEPRQARPFKVPFYPLTPLVFCFTSCYLLYASIMYTGMGALAGIVILLSGLIVNFAFGRKNRKRKKYFESTA
ncbi:APC family permease [Desertivirga xinjiangensis]|uniref:APC family permease n=1 Tax=Desertivirga xinjiangensis TaxID=539206 RepID=UPI00210AE63C|nr:amino acid permease [Pedobacter xinjiangensis]